MYDPEIFKRYDTQTALRIQAEYVRKHSPRPFPRFMEVNRNNSQIDTLWHVPLPERTGFSRQLDIPAINYFEKPNWTLTAQGLVPKRNDRFWLANSILAEESIDYFPERGAPGINGISCNLFGNNTDVFLQEYEVWKKEKS